jgi:hypothetical protein
MSSLLVFIRVYRLENRYSQSYWYFRPSFVNYCPSNLLSSPPPPLPVLKYSIYRQCVAGRGGAGGGGGGGGRVLCRRPLSAKVYHYEERASDR